MQVNPEDHPQDIYVTWSNPRMTDFENGDAHSLSLIHLFVLCSLLIYIQLSIKFNLVL